MDACINCSTSLAAAAVCCVACRLLRCLPSAALPASQHSLSAAAASRPLPACSAAQTQPSPLPHQPPTPAPYRSYVLLILKAISSDSTKLIRRQVLRTMVSGVSRTSGSPRYLFVCESESDSESETCGGWQQTVD